MQQDFENNIIVPEANRISQNDININILSNFLLGMINNKLNQLYFNYMQNNGYGVKSVGYTDGDIVNIINQLKLFKYTKNNPYWIELIKFLQNELPDDNTENIKRLATQPDLIINIYRYVATSILKNIMVYCKFITSSGYTAETTILSEITNKIYVSIDKLSKANATDFSILLIIDSILTDLSATMYFT